MNEVMITNDITINVEYDGPEPQVNKPLTIRVNMENLKNRLISKLTAKRKSIRLSVMLYTPYSEYSPIGRWVALSKQKKCGDIIFTVIPKRTGEHELFIRIFLLRSFALLMEYKTTLVVR